ncbi:alanine--tRNA ligase [Desulfosudis oleivorans]|uniref:Alanine--tRNA ligase n=1 Tax=Desulfosudis oleivorans (strain DSM 6200 / JCM 39069 / Hxd3) TaxID=96561 RepID=SYA_DESOH|nr:alanine--tRNA ligase [Desulfosudis oleivorans]A8ZY67.1 RecName: Full=Alanine--tRNA ligase; AltName: Full=Alanyl-tRNA synthetase; Short=AlaRS [Desulfosudis oleivorans Hxd3]ABW67074.1 alanyl-tRNA synthetase [Desulfosudis oleivorans Hxd3]
MTGNEARKTFLDYFENQGHRVVRSSSLVPQADPTLLFVNAGMVQFKRVFMGEEKRDYTTATTSQKCVRAGGKHNDLENVGYTARHHTFFEMLGNFSFGDYFKERAIELAWDLLLNGYKLPEDKLSVSVFHEDDEAFSIWKDRIGLAESRIARLGEKDNFWSMGDTGPCGPCSEIYMDRGEKYGCGRPDCAPGCDCDRFMEIWNMVFMQYNRQASGELTPLPHPSIDTGMGLERICAVIQDRDTNYETDLFIPIIRGIEAASGKTYGQAPDMDVCMKVIADHSRAAAFLIGDGVLPSNEGKGYVLRRILRRAIRYGRQLGLTRPFLSRTAGTVFEVMAEPYPELKENASFITNVLENEEVRFSETLDNGLRLLSETLDGMAAKGESVIPGGVIFKLYDTYGFPVDIVRDVVREKMIGLDMEGFDAAMAEQKAKSRSVVDFSKQPEAYRNLSAKGMKTGFVGYAGLAAQATVLALVNGGSELETATAGQEIEIVTDTTPFYGASGGQMGDVGVITADGLEITVTDTIKDPTGLVIHKGQVASGTVKKGQTISLAVDEDRRRATAANHTATHLLHAALGGIVGDHVKQAGSMVSPDRMRFDFTHFSMLDRATLDRIEVFVNDRIRENRAVTISEMSMDQAMEQGATALFEEKYGDTVRVVAVDGVSKELCGGTHAQRTGDIGLFKILSEASVASGVRRIEAVTGAGAVAFVQEQMGILAEAAGMLKESPAALAARIQKLLAESRTMAKEIAGLKTSLATASMEGPKSDDAKTLNGVKVIARTVTADNPAALRDLADRLKDKLGSGVVVLGAAADGKAFLIVSVSRDLTGRFKAGDIVREAAAVVGGKGGGRPDMAQAGGPQPEHLEAAIQKACDMIGKG